MRYLAFVAGEGMHSLLGQLKSVLAADDGARIDLFYGVESTARMDALEELQALKNEHLRRLSLYFFFSGEAQESELFNGMLNGGKVRELAGRLFDAQQADEVWVVGSEPASGEIRATLQQLGLDPQKIRNGMGAAPPQQTAVPEGAALANENETQVTVLMDGRRRSFVMTRNNGATVLDAAEQSGLDLPFSCRAGVCSTCRTRVVKGAVTMEENYALEPWELEQGYVLACQSHPTTAELELDYDDK